MIATRRSVLAAGGGLLAGLLLPRPTAFAAAKAVEIRMTSDVEGSHVAFDPIGILVEPGTTIRWVAQGTSHTSTAYHPKNSNHSLRIPETAQPWDSKYLLPGQHFEVTLTVEGVYDYFCVPHEVAGMVGRIIVGHPAGPGTLPFDYFKNDPKKRGWRAVPKLAREAFPPIQEIMRRGKVPAPGVPTSS